MYFDNNFVFYIYTLSPLFNLQVNLVVIFIVVKRGSCYPLYIINESATQASHNYILPAPTAPYPRLYPTLAYTNPTRAYTTPNRAYTTYIHPTRAYTTAYLPESQATPDDDEIESQARFNDIVRASRQRKKSIGALTTASEKINQGYWGCEGR